LFEITFTNSKGVSIKLGINPPFILQKVTGLGDVDASIQTQKAPFQDGSTMIDALLSERPISIELTIMNDDISIKRQELSSVFNPKLGEGTLRINYGSMVKEISAVPEHVPKYPSGSDSRGVNYQSVLIDLLCPNPFLKDINETNEPLTAWLGKFEFPFEFPVEFGERANRVTIENDGDVPTPVLIQFTGPATNPSVINETTGESIKVNRVLSPTDVLEVNTAFGNKTVEIVSNDGTRTNVFNYIDLVSEFFQLQTGENEISFSSDDAASSGSVKISYKKRYLAI
jgi:phage-related protein